MDFITLTIEFLKFLSNLFGGNLGIGIILLTIIVRSAMWSLSVSQQKSMREMQRFQPEMKRIQDRYKSDPQLMQQKMMEFYKKHNFNPMSGCLTSFIQLPIFIAFLEEINRVPAIFEEKFLGLHLGTSPSVGIGNGNWLYVIIVILVGASTWYSFAKAGNSGGNEQQQKQTKMMMNGFSIMITVMSIFMTTALGIYWTVSNLFTLAQNYLVKRRMQND